MKRILYVQYTNPAGYPPLQHSSNILADAGWSVLFLGTGSAGAGSLEFPVRPGIEVRKMPFCQPGWKQKLHFLRFSLWVIWTTILWRPDWVYASDHWSAPVAALLVHLPGIRVIYHEHDTPANRSGNRFLRFVTSCRHHVARNADLCIIPNARRLERFVADAGFVRKALCIWNCPGLYELNEEPRPVRGSDIWVLYQGTLVPERLSPAIIQALAQLPSSIKLRAVGYETAGAQGYVAQLTQLAENLGIGDRVEFLPPVSRNQLFAITSQCDIGLAMIPMDSSDQNFEAMTGASNKVFDYMACGLAVIVSDLPEWRAMFTEPGYGVAANPEDVDGITEAIRKLCASVDTMRAAGDAGRRRIREEWNYEAFFQPAMALLEAE